MIMILNQKGDIMISRQYRYGTEGSVVCADVCVCVCVWVRLHSLSRPPYFFIGTAT